MYLNTTTRPTHRPVCERACPVITSFLAPCQTISHSVQLFASAISFWLFITELVLSQRSYVRSMPCYYKDTIRHHCVTESNTLHIPILNVRSCVLTW